MISKKLAEQKLIEFAVDIIEQHVRCDFCGDNRWQNGTKNLIHKHKPNCPIEIISNHQYKESKK